MTEFIPGQTAVVANDAIKSSLHTMAEARKCSLLWFSEILERKLFRKLGYSSINQYAEVELGFSSSRTGLYLKLSRDLEKFPEVKKQVVTGELGYTKAEAILPVLDPSNESQWLDFAGKHSRRDIVDVVKRAKNNAKKEAADERALQPSLIPDAGVIAKPDYWPGVGSLSQPGCVSQPGSLTGPECIAHSTNAIKPNDFLQPKKAPAANEFTQSSNEPKPGDLPLSTSSPKPNPLPEPVYTPKPMSLPKPTYTPKAVVPVYVNMKMSPIQFARYEGAWEQIRKNRNISADKVEALLEVLESLATEEYSPEIKTETSRRREHSTNNRPPVQIHIHQCPECSSSTIQTSKGELEIGNTALEQAKCDCQINQPGERNSTSIPPKRRREVMTKARHQCQRKGCNHTRFLEVHHIVPRASGGSNELSNLVCICSACHKLLHENKSVGMELLVREQSARYEWQGNLPIDRPCQYSMKEFIYPTQP